MEKTVWQLPFAVISARLGYARSERLDPGRLADLQWRRLRDLVTHCARNVPYYRERFPEWGVSADPTPEQWLRIPPLDKDDVRVHAAGLMADNAARYGITRDSTSGSTGSPLHFILGDRAQAHKIAALLRAFRWAGYRPGMVTLNVQSYYLQDADFHYSPLYRSLRFDSNRLSRGACLKLAPALMKHRPRIVLGFPFDILTIAGVLSEQGIEVPRPKAVITYGETLTEARRKKIAGYFRAPVFNFYSLHEGSALIAECEHGRLHMAEDFARMEVLDDPDPTLGNLVGTNLHNYSMPLLRYRIRDVIEPDGTPCPCGRGLRTVKAIHGKACDYLQTPDGRLLGAVMSHSADNAEGVLLSQCIQETLTRVVVNLVVDGRYTRESERNLEAGLRKRLGPDMELVFRVVPQLRKTASGKTPFIISEIGNTFA